MKCADMPAADAVIHYAEGHTGLAMFHYALPEDTDMAQVAEANGFDSQFAAMEDDDREEVEALKDEYEKGGDGMEIANRWQPVVPEGWTLAERYDTEEGVMAMFIRAKAAPATETPSE